MSVDLVKLRRLAAEFGYWPATTHPEDIERHRLLNIAAEQNLTDQQLQHRYVHLDALSPAGGRPVAHRGLSTADAALRERITELSVHVRCGHLRGPVTVDGQRRWQSCRCEANPQVWADCDVSRAYDLCLLCARVEVVGLALWPWLICWVCHTVNEEKYTSRWGLRSFWLEQHVPLEGHGIYWATNGRDSSGESSSLVGDVESWRTQEVARLAVIFAQQDIPLELWREQWPRGRAASTRVIERLIERGQSSPNQLSEW